MTALEDEFQSGKPLFFNAHSKTISQCVRPFKTENRGRGLVVLMARIKWQPRHTKKGPHSLVVLVPAWPQLVSIRGCQTFSGWDIGIHGRDWLRMHVCDFRNRGIRLLEQIEVDKVSKGITVGS
jgi:hypothetical protein